MPEEAQSAVIDDVLSADDLTRLFGLLLFIGAIETEIRSINLILTGLRLKAADHEIERDLLSATQFVDRIVGNHKRVCDEIYAVIRQRQASSAPAALLH